MEKLMFIIDLKLVILCMWFFNENYERFGRFMFLFFVGVSFNGFL